MGNTDGWVHVQTKLPPDLKRRLKVCAAQNDLPQQELLAIALAEYLDRVAPEPESSPPTPRRGKNPKP